MLRFTDAGRLRVVPVREPRMGLGAPFGQIRSTRGPLRDGSRPDLVTHTRMSLASASTLA